MTDEDDIYSCWDEIEGGDEDEDIPQDDGEAADEPRGSKTSEEADALRKLKNERQKSYQHRRALEARWYKGNVYRLSDELHDRGLACQLSPESQRFLDKLEEYKPRRIPPLLSKMFAGDVKLGKTVTARQVLERIYKGQTEMRAVLRRWRKDGVIVSFEPDPEGGMLDSVYRLVSLPSRYPGTDIDPDEFLDKRMKVE